MRTLLLFRGAPGCGKSTFIKLHKLENYTLEPDAIRMMYQSPQLTVDGGLELLSNVETKVWNTLFDMLEVRMQKGEFTVIDATNSKTAEMKRYKELAEEYRYRIFLIDYTGLPIDECKRRNRERFPEYKRVPEEVIDKMYARFESQKIPSGIKVIDPEDYDDLEDAIFMQARDVSDYKKIHVIGDIHGCYTALKTYLNEYSDGIIKDDELYVFLGDYIDRGIENPSVLYFLMNIVNKPNVILLEGNHERWIWEYANDRETPSREFNTHTKPQLDEINISKKELRKLYRKLGQCAYLKWDNFTFFMCHGGLSTLGEGLFPYDSIGYISTEQMIKGVGKYPEMVDVAKNWTETYDGTHTYQFFGHRNISSEPIIVGDIESNPDNGGMCYVLEGKIEFGGELRCVIIEHADDPDFFTSEEIYTKNEVYRELEQSDDTEEMIVPTDVKQAVELLRVNPFINEKRFSTGSDHEYISSFNFSQGAFEKRVWNNQTVKARGLYIDTDRMKVLARSYDKFFNINETEDTKFDTLEFKLKFPVNAYIKENGYLGIVSYNEETNDFFITTKSNPDADYAQWFRDSFMSFVKIHDNEKEVLEYLKYNNLSFVFEIVDPKRDPHIIEYPNDTILFGPRMYLLDAVKNSLTFEKLSFCELTKIADKFHMTHKIRAAANIENWKEFCDLYFFVSKPDYHHPVLGWIEGFVFEDSNGFMLKYKTQYYNFWKFMRGIAYTVFRDGYLRDTGKLYNELSNKFYGFLKAKYDKWDEENKDIKMKDREKLPVNIIELRNEFYDMYPELLK